MFICVDSVEYTLQCTACGTGYGRRYRRQLCGKCSGILEVRYTHTPSVVPRPDSFWGYGPFLPEGRYRHFEVGFTKLLPSREENLFLKMEIENPTRSFKDRGSVIEVAKAKEYGYREIVCASTGNMAYSIAYYAKLYGIRATVFIGGKANRDKLRDIRETHDARTIRVNGDFTRAQGLAEKYAGKRGAFLAGDYCYRKEGQSTMAYEMLAQLPDASCIIVPVGNATLISGITKVLRNLRENSLKERLPKVIGVESSACSPLEEAFRLKKGIQYQTPKTRADAIAVGMPTFGKMALDDLRTLNGSVVAVTDAEMKREQKSFYEEYGLIAELAGVASIAAYRKLHLGRDEKAVAVISGGNV